MVYNMKVNSHSHKKQKVSGKSFRQKKEKRRPWTAKEDD